MKKSQSYRQTPEAIRLLKALAESMGVSRVAALEVAIRDLAKKRGIK